jgi:hypothetical protein
VPRPIQSASGAKAAWEIEMATAEVVKVWKLPQVRSCASL